MSPFTPPAGQRFLDIELALSQIGDVDAMREMLVMLQEALTRDLPLIAQMLQAGDVAGANGLLHSIKGFLPIFCQDPLCQQVAQVEALSKDGQAVGLADQYANLRPGLEGLLAEVRDHLARPV